VDAQVGDITVDFLLALPGYEENIITRAVRRRMGNLALWICSAEDLIIQKVVANRPKDWQDIEASWRSNTDDWTMTISRIGCNSLPTRWNNLKSCANITTFANGLMRFWCSTVNRLDNQRIATSGKHG